MQPEEFRWLTHWQGDSVHAVAQVRHNANWRPTRVVQRGFAFQREAWDRGPAYQHVGACRMDRERGRGSRYSQRFAEEAQFADLQAISADGRAEGDAITGEGLRVGQ